MKYLFVICFLFQIYTSAAGAQAYKYHTVKKGETVFSISQSYDIEEEDIYKFNPDAKDGIEVNEKLVIPVQAQKSVSTTNSTVKFKEHKVARKETLYSLSKQYDVSIDEIKRYNKHLYSEELRSGEIVQIPVGGKPSPAQVTPDPGSSSAPARSSQISSTREHIVLPKETKFGIARKYGMTIKELDALNPQVETLQPGMMIRVGTDVLEDEPVIITDERFTFYEVKPKETLFSLSQRFGVSQDSLLSLNPGLKDGLKFGMVLKVPESESSSGEVATRPGNFEESASTKLDLSNSLNNFRKKEIALMLPFNTDNIVLDSLPTYRKAVMDQRVTRISLDFYSGVLMALDKARTMGISTNLRVYDTKGRASEAANIINTNNFSSTDAVIGPLLQESSEAAASRLENLGVPVINPLSNREMRGYENLFQARPSEEVLRNAMLDYIAKNSEGKNLIIVADGRSLDIKNKLSRMLPAARFANPVDNVVRDMDLSKMMTQGKNWVILESENINVLSSTTSALNRLARQYDITLLTTNKNNGFENENISNNHLGRLKFHYPSVDKEYDAQDSEEFVKAYAERFANEPNQYAVRGYDLTLDVLLRLAAAENFYESFERYPGYTEYHESKFHYLPNSGGGYANDAIYILKLNEDLSISEANDF